MSKRKYLSLAMEQPISWLTDCVNHPSTAMLPIHVALIRIAIRRLTV